MGIFKKIWHKLNDGFFYMVDIYILKEYIDECIRFSQSENLECVEEFNIYIGDEKKNIYISNSYACDEVEEQNKGILYYFEFRKDNEKVYRSFEDLIDIEFPYLPEKFKIELVLGDSVFLERYKIDA